jgi:ABC-type transport system involved in multi-copper enzyme maturation permease subunit
MRARLSNLQLGINPIIVKELRARMRETRAFAILTGVLLALGIVSYLIYRMALVMAGAYASTPLSPQIGQMLFIALAFLELMMVCAIAPAVTAGAISGEQEKLTYEMLLATPLHPASILWGKLVSALSYVFLLIFAAIPMFSLIFIFGGVTVRDLLKALLILVVVAITFGIMGLFMSAWLKRTSRATVASFLIVVALIAGTFFLYVAIGVIRQVEPPRWLLAANPVSALFSALSNALPNESSAFGFIGMLGWNLGGSLRLLSGSTISYTGIPRPLYHYSLPLYIGLALFLYMLSTRLVLPTHRWRLDIKQVLFALILLAAFGGAVALAFMATADRYENASGSAVINPLQPVFGKGIMEPPVQILEVPAVEVLPYPGPDSNADTPTSYPAPEQASPLPVEDQGGIYAAAIRQLVTVDFFSSQTPPAEDIYLVQWTDDSAGDPALIPAESRQLPEELQTQISAALEDLPAQVHWIGNPDELNFLPETGEIEGGGVIITLGSIHDQGEDSVLLSAAIYPGSAKGMGKTYNIEKIDGAWQITGTTGE